MQNLVLWCCTLYLLTLINTVYSTINVEIEPSDVLKFKPLDDVTIKCIVTNTDDATSTPTIRWKKNDEEIATSENGRYKSSWQDSKVKKNGSYVNVLTVSKMQWQDAGNYSCVAQLGVTGTEYSSKEIPVRADFQVAVATHDINVVEEEKLRVECRLKGNATLYWIFKDVSYNQSEDRVNLYNFTFEGVEYERGTFVLNSTEKGDRGILICVGVNEFTKEEIRSECMVRIVDKYAALWPFLGICAEVVILCAIIVIYEKKRNKTELEESDTDQSPDQKTNADHNKDSNLRHRQ